jgi:hypothetical protein
MLQSGANIKHHYERQQHYDDGGAVFAARVQVEVYESRWTFLLAEN